MNFAVFALELVLYFVSKCIGGATCRYDLLPLRFRFAVVLGFPAQVSIAAVTTDQPVTYAVYYPMIV